MKLTPESSARWMIRIDSSWSLLPQSPNIIAPRQSGLTLTPVEPRLRSCMAPDLVDRCESGLEPVARRTHVQATHADALLAGQPHRPVDVVVQAPCPVTQGLRVVVLEAFDVLDLEARALERQLDAREGQRVPIGEDVALGERPWVGRVGIEACDAVIQQAAAGLEQAVQLLRVAVDLHFADVLDHADRCDRIEALSVQLAVVLHADVHHLTDACFTRALTRDARLRLPQRGPRDVPPVLLRRVDPPAAPATADVEHALAGPQVQLRADEL